MLTVQFAGPQNLRSCPERGGVGGGERLLERPGVQRCRKCETSPPPYSPREARPTPVSSRAPASEGCCSQTSARNSDEGARGKPRPGGAGGSGRAQRPALVHRGPGPKFPEPAALRTFQRTRPNARPSSWPPTGHHRQSFLLGPSLPCLVSSSIAPAPILSRANPEPVWCRLHLAFSVLALSDQQSGGKAQTKKLPLKNFSATRLSARGSARLKCTFASHSSRVRTGWSPGA